MNKKQSTPWFLLAATLVALQGGPAWAEDPAPPNTGPFALTVSLNFPTSYYFRGIAQSNAGFHFQPYAELKANETSGGADGAGRFGGHHGIYMELGIDPGYTVDFSKNWSARFHLPFLLGLSLHNYYEVATTTGVKDKTFGYADLALAADVPLKFMPARYGRWTFTSGLHMLWLGENNKLLAGPPSPNALNALNVTGGKGFEVWGVTGLRIEY